jgi:hypothetical protein
MQIRTEMIEMFSQGEPVLAWIDLDSGFLFSLSHESSRDGETWTRVLNEAKSQQMQHKMMLFQAHCLPPSGPAKAVVK